MKSVLSEDESLYKKSAAGVDQLFGGKTKQCSSSKKSILRFLFKGIVVLISSNPTYKEGQTRFTMVPFKLSSETQWGRIRRVFS